MAKISRNILMLRLSLSLVLVLAGCSSDDNPTDEFSADADASFVEDSSGSTDMDDTVVDMPRDDLSVEDTGVTEDSGIAGDTGPDADAGLVADVGPDVQQPAPEPIVLTSTYLGAKGNATRGTSAWGTASYPDALPENARSTIFWGRFLQNACANPGYGLTIEHPLTVSGTTVFDAWYPDCMGSYGPSVDADVYANGAPQHLLRSESRPAGAFQDFGNAGQNASGANKDILAAYSEFSPSWRSNAANRLRPWSGPSVGPDALRVAVRVKQSVTQDLLEAPSAQQLQQVIRFLVINENCAPAQSSSFCQIEFNFKTYNRGFGAYTSFTSGDVFNDAGQGGLIAVVGPIADTGQTTSILGSPAWSSWASSTQLQPFQDRTFQVEISWTQFQQLLSNVTNQNPAAVFGASWNDPQTWVMLRIGYGQENYNASGNASSLLEGLFESVEVFAL